MEIKIGIQNIGREIVLESAQDADTVATVVEEAITKGTELRPKATKAHINTTPGHPPRPTRCCP